MPDLTRAKWRKSSYSSGDTNGQCVEVALGDGALVRDTKNRKGSVLQFTGDAWASFVAAEGQARLASDQ